MRMGIAIALGMFACVDESSTSQPTEPHMVSYRNDIQPVWNRYCITCHNFHTPHLNPQEGPTHLAGTSWWKCDGDTKARFVVPGEPARSYLLYKLTGENTNSYTAECARPMPADVNGESIPLVQLDAEAVATIRRWIEEGAAFD